MAKIEQTEKGIIKISVRNLVEFILREGDIDNREARGGSVEAMQAGSRIHRKIQKQMGAGYHAEVPLRLAVEWAEYTLVIEGRADGILITGADGTVPYGYGENFNRAVLPDNVNVTIDEIKGIYKKLEFLDAPIGVHRAQAMCYAYMYAAQHDLSRIQIQMTYCNLDTQDIRYFRETFSFEELSEWFAHLTGEYKKWADFQFAWHRLRQASIKKLEFPFPYRRGQKELVSGVYRTISRRKNLFIQAPTGVGKTISTVFPAVKAVGEELGDRIFYLTAKTMTGMVAWDTFALLRRQGYQAKVIQITAKEKLCPLEEMDCNPVSCPYAKGHYDRVNDAVYALLQKEDMITRETVLEQAEQFSVCPFELCLDVSSWSDVIICDYNYVFDPNVYLKRFFAEGSGGEYIFLIDEAHNLVERSRNMYSAAICKEDFLEIKKMMKPHSPKIVQELEKCNRILLSYKRECEKYVIYESIGNLALALTRLASDLDEFLQKSAGKSKEKQGGFLIGLEERREVTEFYLNLRRFMNVYERLDEHYVIYTEHGEDGNFRLRLYCVDPSRNLQECINRGKAAIFFSATLLPINYYKNLLSTEKENYAVYAESTFSEKQRLLLVGSDVSSKYTRRNPLEFEKIAAYLAQTVQAKTGNYMVFFPSYKMMQQVREVFDADYPGAAECVMQQSGMKEEEREAFLAAFEEVADERGKSLLAFCVMGGIFGEGIDLKKERLIGTIIVGTGLPQISNEREILMGYYEKHLGEGFNYAYRYPGMNKVLQAGGRVIRTAEDTGVILLLDERFLQSDYQGLFPREWKSRRICNLNNVGKLLEEFWNSDFREQL